MASKERDKQAYREDCNKNPKDTLKEEDYNGKRIYESVITVSRVVTGKDEEGIGTLGRRQYYYRLCRDLLYRIFRVSGTG